MNRRLTAVVSMVLLGGCGLPFMPTPPAPAQPADPAARMRPDLIAVEPAEAEPGDVVGLSFPQETARGILFTLERLTADGWLTSYLLTSDGPGPEWQLSWQPPGGGGMAVEDIGVGGPGPDHVPIPDVAEPGSYRICTGNAAEVICTPIEIRAER